MRKVINSLLLVSIVVLFAGCSNKPVSFQALASEAVKMKIPEGEASAAYRRSGIDVSAQIAKGYLNIRSSNTEIERIVVFKANIPLSEKNKTGAIAVEAKLLSQCDNAFDSSFKRQAASLSKDCSVEAVDYKGVLAYEVKINTAQHVNYLIIENAKKII